jgi:translation initiation factor 5B
MSPSASKPPVELTPDELIEEEWGPVKKKKKDKKGKAPIDVADEEDERKGFPAHIYPLLSTEALAENTEPQVIFENQNPDEIDESGVTVLSKKEKEKLKKEREKVS